MKKSIFVTLLIVSLGFLFSSCGTTRIASFPQMYDEDPVVMLIMPPINNSSAADAKDYFYTTMNVPLAEAGYYVLPPAVTMATLQKESAYDAEKFVEGDLKKFGKLFGADVAVFTVIKSWNKSLVGSAVIIEIEYIFRSTKTNETLYHRDARITCDTSTGVATNSLIGSLLIATADAIKTAATDYVSVAVKCNKSALKDVPYGKYHPKHGADKELSAMPEKINISASK